MVPSRPLRRQGHVDDPGPEPECILVSYMSSRKPFRFDKRMSLACP